MSEMVCAFAQIMCDFAHLKQRLLPFFKKSQQTKSVVSLIFKQLVACYFYFS